MDVLREFRKKFTDADIGDITRIGRSFFSIDPELDSVRKRIDNNLNREPEHAGVFLGSLRGKRFEPGFPLLDILAENTERFVVVDDKAEWLFLCGRDIFGSSVLRSGVEKGPALVLNQKEEVLGYGDVTGRKADRESIFLNNILDRGDFLRREMKRK